jgi:hypothetical protein
LRFYLEDIQHKKGVVEWLKWYECLPSKPKAPNSNTSTTKKKSSLSFVTPKTGNNPKISWEDNGQSKREHSCIMEYYTTMKDSELQPDGTIQLTGSNYTLNKIISVRKFS